MTRSAGHTAAHAAPDVGPDGPAAALQLQWGFRWMCFTPALEPAYRRDQFLEGVKHLRISLVVLIMLVFAIVELDRIVIPTIGQLVPNAVRLAAMGTALALSLALTFPRTAPRLYPPLVSVFMTIALIGVAWAGLLAWSHGESRVFARLIVAITALYFVLGLRFRLAIVANLITLVFYITAAVALRMPPLQLWQFLAMLILTSVTCASGAYNLEHARRTAWLERQRLAEIAQRDGLTGIHNRRRLDEHLRQAWRQGLRTSTPLAILLADIDCFKAFNDHYGHQAGDDALRAVADVHSRLARRPLDIAARFGGEEYAIVLFDANPEHARRIGEELRAGVRRLGIAHAHSNVAPVLTISVGVACSVPGATGQPGELLQLADHALYAAKHGGRDRVQLHEPVSRR